MKKKLIKAAKDINAYGIDPSIDTTLNEAKLTVELKESAEVMMDEDTGKIQEDIGEVKDATMLTLLEIGAFDDYPDLKKLAEAITGKTKTGKAKKTSDEPESLVGQNCTYLEEEGICEITEEDGEAITIKDEAGEEYEVNRSEIAVIPTVAEELVIESIVGKSCTYLEEEGICEITEEDGDGNVTIKDEAGEEYEVAVSDIAIVEPEDEPEGECARLLAVHPTPLI